MTHSLAIRVARILRSYGFLAVAAGATVVTDASDDFLAETIIDARIGGR